MTTVPSLVEKVKELTIIPTTAMLRTLLRHDETDKLWTCEAGSELKTMEDELKCVINEYKTLRDKLPEKFTRYCEKIVDLDFRVNVMIPDKKTKNKCITFLRDSAGNPQKTSDPNTTKDFPTLVGTTTLLKYSSCVHNSIVDEKKELVLVEKPYTPILNWISGYESNDGMLAEQLYNDYDMLYYYSKLLTYGITALMKNKPYMEEAVELLTSTFLLRNVQIPRFNEEALRDLQGSTPEKMRVPSGCIQSSICTKLGKKFRRSKSKFPRLYNESIKCLEHETGPESALDGTLLDAYLCLQLEQEGMKDKFAILPFVDHERKSSVECDVKIIDRETTLGKTVFAPFSIPSDPRFNTNRHAYLNIITETMFIVYINSEDEEETAPSRSKRMHKKLGGNRELKIIRSPRQKPNTWDCIPYVGLFVKYWMEDREFTQESADREVPMFRQRLLKSIEERRVRSRELQVPHVLQSERKQPGIPSAQVKLTDLMVKPVQRLPSVVLLLKEMAKKSDSRLKSSAEEAARTIDEVLKIAIKTREKNDNLISHMSKFTDIENVPPHLVATNWMFIRELVVSPVASTSQRLQQFMKMKLFLFHDVLIITKIRSEKNKMQRLARHASFASLHARQRRPHKYIEQIPLNFMRSASRIRPPEDLAKAIEAQQQRSNSVIKPKGVPAVDGIGGDTETVFESNDGEEVRDFLDDMHVKILTNFGRYFLLADAVDASTIDDAMVADMTVRYFKSLCGAKQQNGHGSQMNTTVSERTPRSKWSHNDTRMGPPAASQSRMRRAFSNAQLTLASTLGFGRHQSRNNLGQINENSSYMASPRVSCDPAALANMTSVGMPGCDSESESTPKRGLRARLTSSTFLNRSNILGRNTSMRRQTGFAHSEKEPPRSRTSSHRVTDL